MMREIAFTSIKNMMTGHAQDETGGTGCTVIIFPTGAPAGIDIRGGGPASRESALLSPLSHAEAIHAIFFSGGSAFGLDAAGGVMKYLEEKDIGFKTGIATIPLVAASCIFDLVVGSPKARPDAAMAYAACLEAEKNAFGQGNVGAGAGATVGKYNKSPFMMKSGLGTYAVETGGLQVGALAVVNAVGDVYENGRIIAGMLNKEANAFANTEHIMFDECTQNKGLFSGNTTLVAVVTNAAFNKTQLTKIAGMAQNGMARAISPVHTMADGDSAYAMSVGQMAADINAVGTLAARVTERAIINAVKAAAPAYGLKTAGCFNK